MMKEMWWVVFAVILTLSRSDNPTAIVKPYDGPDPGYIVAESGVVDYVLQTNFLQLLSDGINLLFSL